MGRQIEKLIALEEQSGLTILASTGYYYGVFLPDSFKKQSVEEVATDFIEEITQGIEGTSKKASFIGEIGTPKEGVSAYEKRFLRQLF